MRALLFGTTLTIGLVGSGNELIHAQICEPVLKSAVVEVLRINRETDIDQTYELAFSYEHSQHQSGETNLSGGVSGFFASLGQEEYNSMQEEYNLWKRLDLTVQLSESIVRRAPNNAAVEAWLECIKNVPLHMRAEPLGTKDVVVSVKYTPRRRDPARIRVASVLPVNMSLKGGTSTILEQGKVLGDGQSVSAVFERSSSNEPSAIIVDFESEDGLNNADLPSLRRYIRRADATKRVPIRGNWTAFVRAKRARHPVQDHLGDPDSRCHLTMSANVDLSHDATNLVARLAVEADEGRHDWSYGYGAQEFILYTAPPGFRIIGIASPQQRSDSLHYREKGAGGNQKHKCEGHDYFTAGQGGNATNNGVVAEWDCVGDVPGPELGGATGCRARLHDARVIIEKVEN